MKQVNITFEDKEYIEILQAKERHKGNWHDFLLDLARKYNKKKEKLPSLKLFGSKKDE